MSSGVPVVAIVGRTNVGKSTLFNALTRKRVAIVEDSPGVTRDRHYALIEHYGDAFTLVDTGGLVGEDDAAFRRFLFGKGGDVFGKTFGFRARCGLCRGELGAERGQSEKDEGVLHGRLF